MKEYDLKKLVPHRNSMLLLDQIVSIDETCAEGVYKVKGNEFFFYFLFSYKKIVPGSILCEIMAQLTAAFVGYTRKIDGIPVVAEMQNVKFKKLVLPCDLISVKMEVIKDSFRVLRADCSTYVENVMAAEAELTIVIK